MFLLISILKTLRKPCIYLKELLKDLEKKKKEKKRKKTQFRNTFQIRLVLVSSDVVSQKR